MPPFGPPDIEKLERERNVGGLIKALRHNDASVRAKAAYAMRTIQREAALGLADRRDSRVVSALIGALRDPHAEVRRKAADALGELADSRAVEPLISALSDDEPDVRQAAAGAMADQQDLRVIEPLIAALGDQDAWVRFRAAAALGIGRHGRATEPLLDAALTDVDEGVRLGATRALGELGAVEALITVLRQAGTLDQKREAAQRLVGGRTAEPLITVLGDNNEDVSSRCLAAWALGQRDLAVSVEPLIAALSDEHSDIQQAAADALSRIGGERASKALREYHTQQP